MIFSGFFKKNDEKELPAPTTKSSLSFDEKIAMVDKIYQDFLIDIGKVERERDRRIALLLKEIDEEKINNVLKKIDQRK